jgi:hypothetical protein
MGARKFVRLGCREVFGFRGIFAAPKNLPLKSGNGPPLMLLYVYRAKKVKVLKRKELQTLSLVAPERPRTTQPIMFPAPATDAIRLSESETVRRPRLSASEVKRRLLLSAVDVMRVNRATIREGEGHCIWPPEIVERFRSADVVTEKSVSHYILREGTLTRVK